MRGEKKLLMGFKEGIFPLNHDDEFEEQQTSKKFNKKEPPIKLPKTDVNELNELIIKKETDTDRELFKNYFNCQIPSVMFNTLYNLEDKKKNNLLVG